MNYTTEVEFLRAEVEKCHASMHSQIETISLLMKKNIALKEQNREWVGLTYEEVTELSAFVYAGDPQYVKLIETKLREKNGG
jgi:hypothetical protein